MRCSSVPSIAHGAGDQTPAGRVRVTHRFHPLFGQSFEFVKRLQAWQSDLVYFLDAAGELASVPAAWTDLVAPDPFVVVAAGRAAFRAGDLAELADLVSACLAAVHGITS
jgi:hypothetical protein